MLRITFLAIFTLLFVLATATPALGNEVVEISQYVFASPLSPILVKAGIHNFTLRHLFHHGAYLHPRLHRRKDLPRNQLVWTEADDVCAEKQSSFITRSSITSIQRLKDRRPSTVDSMMAEARQHGSPLGFLSKAWSFDEVLTPNVSDKETILNLAHMGIDAYYMNDTCEGWDDIGHGYNNSDDFGWEGDGLRGHVFVDQTNSTAIISIKGTSKALWDGDGTTKNDKENDNLFGSCCCAQQSAPTSRKVCDCATSTYVCNNTCTTSAIMEESRYYTAARHIYSNVTLLYPEANIWLVGHSLGGTVSSLLGLTYGSPAITFEAVPDALAAKRLGLPIPPQLHHQVHQARDFTGIYHFGNTADPVYMGVCNGWTALCSIWGYAFETQCHTGKRCVYDVVTDKGWRVDIRKHVLRTVIDEIITEYDTVPECIAEAECQDCFNWKYFEGHEQSTTTSTSSTSSTTSSSTLTSTCKTPGWWGCLDKSTSTSSTESTAAAPLPSTTLS